MKQGKGEIKSNGPTTKIELELEKSLVDQLLTMEDYTKISRTELVTTALKRFISSHSDYFPDKRS